MSFSAEVKTELCECEVPEASKEALRYGLVYGFRANCSFVTYDRKTAYFVKKQLPKKKTDFLELKNKKNISYCINISDMALQATYGFLSPDINTGITGETDEQVGMFLRGVFLTCGNVYVQKAGYHLELNPATSEKCEALYRLMTEHGMDINISHRGNYMFLYSKNSENISDILTYMGAMQCAMEIMNIKIIKEVRSNINRSVNCETANIDRTVKASAKQIEDIELLYSELGKDKLADELLEIAELRLNNPDMSLRDLGKLADPVISRSGANHRFERIAKLADELRNKR